MKNKLKKSTLLAIIALTLLLHLLFLYFFTTIPFSSAPDRISELIQSLLGKSAEQPEEKPQLQSHAPQQSAPVIFRDEPEEEITKKQTPPPEPKTLVSHAANPLNKPIEEKENARPAPEPIQKPSQATIRESQERHNERVEKTKKEEKAGKEKIQKPEEKIEITKSVLRAPQGERMEQEPSIKREKTSLSVRPDLSALALATEEVLRDPSPSVRPESIEGPLKKSSLPPQNKKNQVSLAQLSQQFMQKMATVETGGHGALRVEGNAAYGHPSAYQIALERYVAKMCTEIETAYRIGTNQSVQATQHKPFNLLVELNSNGALNTIYPSPSSGLARIDEFAISIFKSASKSFPKLPEAIGSTLRIQFGINHIDHLAQLSQGVLTSR